LFNDIGTADRRDFARKSTTGHRQKDEGRGGKRDEGGTPSSMANKGQNSQNKHRKNLSQHCGERGQRDAKIDRKDGAKRSAISGEEAGETTE
jgi:hypothetical protein